MSVHEMHPVNRHMDHKAVVKKIGHITLIKRWLKALPSIFDTIYRSMKMYKQWPADEFQQHLDRPLHEIRSEFNIKLPASKSFGGGSSGAALRHIRA